MNPLPTHAPPALRILVVEAVRAAAIDLQRTLQDLGYGDCAVAASAEQAMQMAATESPDLVFIDIHLKRADDGFDTAARLAEAHDPSFLFISAQSGEADLQHALEGSRFHYAASPFEPEQVRQVMKDALSIKRGPGLTRAELGVFLVQDSVTGLGNPRKLQHALRREWERCELEGAQLAVLAAELDNFEAYAAHHGQEAGEACLADFARTLEVHCMRARDVACHMEGPKFTVLLPATHPEGASLVGGWIVQAVRDLQSGPAFSAPSITVSVGVSVTQPEADADPQELLRKAERALAAAQDLGGNNVVAAGLPRGAQQPTSVWWKNETPGRHGRAGEGSTRSGRADR